MQVIEKLRFMRQPLANNSDIIHPCGSIDGSYFIAYDGSHRGSPRPRRSRHPRIVMDHDHDRSVEGSHVGMFGGLSTLLPVMRRGISAVRKPDAWTQNDVTVDCGACVSVMPIGICEGISVLGNRPLQKRSRIRGGQRGDYAKSR